MNYKLTTAAHPFSVFNGIFWSGAFWKERKKEPLALFQENGFYIQAKRQENQYIKKFFLRFLLSEKKHKFSTASQPPPALSSSFRVFAKAVLGGKSKCEKGGDGNELIFFPLLLNNNQ